MRKFRLEEMTSQEVREALQRGIDTIVLPVGAIEQHGPHGALGVDAFCAQVIAERVAERLGALLAPLMPYGSSSGHMAFSGTISLRNETLQELTKDICRSLVKHGFQKIVIINGNEPNYYPMMAAIREVREESGGKVLITLSNWYAALMEGWRELQGIKGTEREGWSWPYFMSHGGLLETSVAMVQKEEAFRMDRAISYGSERREAFSNPIVSMPTDMREVCREGSYGDPRGASAELGKVWADLAADRIVKGLRRLFEVASRPP